MVEQITENGFTIEGSEKNDAYTTPITPEISATLTGDQLQINWGWQSNGRAAGAGYKMTDIHSSGSMSGSQHSPEFV